jgi:hypothetical protein
MHSIPHDRLILALHQARSSLSNVRHAMEQHGHALSSGAREMLEGFLDAAQGDIDLVRADVEADAEGRRSEITRDRAWQLVRLQEIGALDRDGYHELALLCNPMLHERHRFPEDLRQRLATDALILDILDHTVFTCCIAGVFQW